MSGIELVLIGCVGVNTAINVIQSSGVASRLSRWFRLSGCKLVTISRDHNPGVFYQVTKVLHSVSANLRLRTLISFGDQKETHSYFVPDRNTEILLPTLYGSLWIKVVSLDGYRLDAYEITCKKAQPYAMDKFLHGVFQSLNPAIPVHEMESMRIALDVSPENDQRYLVPPPPKKNKTLERLCVVMAGFVFWFLI